MVDRFERFSLAIFEISRCWHKLAAEEMAKYGLKGPHAIYLLTLMEHGAGMTAAQICEVCSRDKAEVSRSVALMEEKGLVKKDAVNQNAYRALLSLTEEGVRAAQHVTRRASVAVELAGGGITAEEREVFYRALESITANLQILSKNGLPQKEELK